MKHPKRPVLRGNLTTAQDLGEAWFYGYAPSQSGSVQKKERQICSGRDRLPESKASSDGRENV